MQTFLLVTVLIAILGVGGVLIWMATRPPPVALKRWWTMAVGIYMQR